MARASETSAASRGPTTLTTTLKDLIIVDGIVDIQGEARAVSGEDSRTIGRNSSIASTALQSSAMSTGTASVNNTNKIQYDKGMAQRRDDGNE